MKKLRNLLTLLLVVLLHGGLSPFLADGQNPLIKDQFSADPTARVFGDSLYLFPSHDILATADFGKEGWFCMRDYHVFSTKDLINWKDHGVIVSQKTAPWVDTSSYSMWAPDCVYTNGKYYFYFPAKGKAGSGQGFGIGVATADRPYGPYVPEKKTIQGVHGIDPNVFIDVDGQAYLYWAQGNIYVAKLKSNMLELGSAPVVVGKLPEKGLKEGPFLFERKGVYYLTYPHVADKTEQLEYAVSDNPMGPFKVTGVIMDATPDCWTNHQSILQYNGQWYLFYHHDDYSPKFDKARSVRADSLFFNTDGTIRKVIPTLRGIGVSRATSRIEIDRYSLRSGTDVSLKFLDSTNTFKGWAINLEGKGAYVQYNSVDFGVDNLQNIVLKMQSSGATALEIRLDGPNGPVIANVRDLGSKVWGRVQAKLTKRPSGIHNLVICQRGAGQVSLDWVQFR